MRRLESFKAEFISFSLAILAGASNEGVERLRPDLSTLPGLWAFHKTHLLFRFTRLVKTICVMFLCFKIDLLCAA